MKTRVFRSALGLGLMVCMGLFSVHAWAAEPVGVVLAAIHGVWIERDGEKQAAQVNDVVQVKDSIVTDNEGRAHIFLHDSMLVAMGNESVLAIAAAVVNEETKAASLSVNMTRGVVRFEVKETVEHGRRSFSVSTPSAIMDIPAITDMVKMEDVEGMGYKGHMGHREGAGFGVEVSLSGVTRVTGLNINPDVPLPVENIHTGTTDRIDKNGLAVKTSLAGNTCYMAPTGTLSDLSEAVAIRGASVTDHSVVASDAITPDEVRPSNEVISPGGVVPVSEVSTASEAFTEVEADSMSERDK